MQKFAIVATLGITPGRMDEFLPMMMTYRDRFLKEEPGTLQFEVLQLSDDDTKLILFEVYADETAFQTHWNGPARDQIFKEGAGMFTILQGINCTLLE